MKKNEKNMEFNTLVVINVLKTMMWYIFFNLKSPVEICMHIIRPRAPPLSSCIRSQGGPVGPSNTEKCDDV